MEFVSWPYSSMSSPPQRPLNYFLVSIMHTSCFWWSPPITIFASFLTRKRILYNTEGTGGFWPRQDEFLCIPDHDGAKYLCRIQPTSNDKRKKGITEHWSTSFRSKEWWSKTDKWRQGWKSLGSDGIVMDSTHAQSIYDTPGSLMDYTNRRDEPWQAHDGMELRLVSKDDQGKPSAGKGVEATLKKGKLTTIGPKYFPVQRSSDEGSLAFGSFQHVWKSVLGVVLLSFVLSLVAVILAAVALKNPAGRSGVSDGSLPASQRSFGSNLSTGK